MIPLCWFVVEFFSPNGPTIVLEYSLSMYEIFFPPSTYTFYVEKHPVDDINEYLNTATFILDFQKIIYMIIIRCFIYLKNRFYSLIFTRINNDDINFKMPHQILVFWRFYLCMFFIIMDIINWNFCWLLNMGIFFFNIICFKFFNRLRKSKNRNIIVILIRVFVTLFFTYGCCFYLLNRIIIQVIFIIWDF